MRQEAWRAYVQMAMGMTEASRRSATTAVRRLLGKGGATAEQLQELAQELLKTSTANREVITKMVRIELDRTLTRMGLATSDEVGELTERVRTLERQVRTQRESAGREAATAPAKKATKKATRTATAQPGAARSAGTSTARGAGTSAARKATAKKTAKKATAKAATAKKSPGRASKVTESAAPRARAKRAGTAASGTAASGTARGARRTPTGGGAQPPAESTESRS